VEGAVVDNTEIKDVATIVGVLVGAVSLAFTALNTRRTALTNRAKFWLDLRSTFTSHDEIHHKLHPRGDWKNPRAPTEEEQFQVEAYMGLFEHCEIMLEEGLIDEKTFKEVYRYRLMNLVANDWVRVEKLCNIPQGWKRFIALLARMDVPYSCPKQ
jgi:hypothetical protein